MYPQDQTAKKKRPQDGEDEEQEGIPKRVRPNSELEDEVGRGIFEIDGGMNIMDDSSINEIGREAGSALQDHPSSAIMPWNQSQSLHSHKRGGSSRGHGSQAGRRLTSASPLIGRGSNLPEGMDQFSMMDEDQVMYGRDDNVSPDDDDAFLRRGVSQTVVSSSHAEAEFEMFGPAAQVDTQTAGTSQWVKEALDRESGNFFEYVSNTINEKIGDELDDIGDDAEQFVTFEELFVPEANSAIVAAQAFYHVLSLATKNRVWVEQSLDENLLEAFGEIRIGIFA